MEKKRTNQLHIVQPAQGITLDLRPLEGLWTEEQYLALTDHTRYLVEFSDGSIEILPMPTDHHQSLVQLLFLALLTFINPLGGKVHFAPLRLQIRPGKQREPDLLLVRDANDARRQNRFWMGADLVVEVISPDDPERDTIEKVADYAEAQIPEYWIVDPNQEQVTVLLLDGGVYRQHGVFARGDQATSLILTGFSIDVDTLFDAR